LIKAATKKITGNTHPVGRLTSRISDPIQACTASIMRSIKCGRIADLSKFETDSGASASLNCIRNVAGKATVIQLKNFNSLLEIW
jgi:hypothetical protein